MPSSGRIDLPDDLVPLITGKPHLHVFGPVKPWVPPAGWAEDTRRQVLAIARRRGLTDRPASKNRYKEGTSYAVESAEFLSDLLLGASAQVSGLLRNASEQLVADCLRKPPTVIHNTTQVVRVCSQVQTPGGMYTDADSPARRDLVMGYYRDLFALLAEFPPFEPRARALVAVYDRIGSDADLLAAHRTRPVAELRDLWRATLLTDSDAAVLPDYLGPLAYLSWTLSGLRALHERLLATAGPEGGSFTDLIACMLLRIDRQSVPAGLAATELSVDDTEAIEQSLGALRSGYDSDAWQGRLRGWLERAIVVGEAETARIWVSLHWSCLSALKGWPGQHAFPGTGTIMGPNYLASLQMLCGPRRVIVNPLVAQMSALVRSYVALRCRDRRWPALSCRACRRFLATCRG